MTSLKNANRRVGSLFAVAALVLATITPGLVPAFASAAQVTERSVSLSSSSASNANTTYKVKFTPVSNAAAFVIEFCSDSPLIESTCTSPAGMTVASAAAATDYAADWTVAQTTASAAAGGTDHRALVATGDITAATEVEVDIAGITNPSAVATTFARIVTYSDATDAAAYTSTDLGDNSVDQGGAAFSITNTVGVSGAVLESMTFCVSASAPADGCASGVTPPTLKLGKDVGGVIALDNTLSTGSIYSQLSTNASSGAVVNLKSGNTCGGLKRATATDCDISAAMASAAAAGQPRIGITVSPTNGTLDSGTSFGIMAVAGGGSPFYNGSDYKLNYTSGGASGVTSAFGDSILDTAGKPVTNKNATITFGASINAQTPAGLYSNDYSLIATGKY